jgi:hypothetical protein
MSARADVVDLTSEDDEHDEPDARRVVTTAVPHPGASWQMPWLGNPTTGAPGAAYSDRQLPWSLTGLPSS